MFSPYTWNGKVQSTHIHVFTAVFLGGVISSFPIILAFLRPRQAITRYTFAIAQMLWSALLIHLTGGRIETHFHARPPCHVQLVSIPESFPRRRYHSSRRG